MACATLIVKKNTVCVDLLRYIYKNIDTIVDFGFALRILKVDKAAKFMKTHRVNRVPALVSPEGRIYTGLGEITDLFERNISQAGSAHNRELISDNQELSDYWHSQMFKGRDRSGHMVTHKMEDEPEDSNADIDRKLAEYERNVPSHRRPDGRGRGQTRLYRDDPEEREDNIERRPPRRELDRDDDLDNQLMAAWLEGNNHGD